MKLIKIAFCSLVLFSGCLCDSNTTPTASDTTVNKESGDDSTDMLNPLNPLSPLNPISPLYPTMQ